ncbi:MAG: hypothetical protein AAFY88_26175 [Acidobacteriota bacterium]
MTQKLFQGLFSTLLAGALAFATVAITSAPAGASQGPCSFYHPPAGCTVQLIEVDGGSCCEFSGPSCTPAFIGPCWGS